MTRRYAVIGNPVRHSLSPWLHRHFARTLQYDTVYAAYAPPVDGFGKFAQSFFAAGGCGLNITTPFKKDALDFADIKSDFSKRVKAANVLALGKDGICAYNTDGAGLIADITGRCETAIGNSKVLLVGAGGGARAAAHALAGQKPALLCITNRSPDKGVDLAASVGGEYRPFAECTAGFGIIINATACGLAGEAPPLPQSVFSGATLAYDMSYGKAAKPFMNLARQAKTVFDGLGMLVEQAALSYALWETARPQTKKIIRELTGA